MAAGFAGFLALEYPQVGTAVLVAVAVLTVLNQLVGRDGDDGEDRDLDEDRDRDRK